MDAEGLEEAPDVVRNVLVALDPAVDKQSWGRKIPNTPGSGRVVIFTAGFRAVGARTATGSRAGAMVVIRHAVSKSWEVNSAPLLVRARARWWSRLRRGMLRRSREE